MLDNYGKRMKAYGVVYGTFTFIAYCIITAANVGGAKILNRIIGLKKIIVLKGQTDFEGNCRALYDELIKSGYVDNYTIVWHIDCKKNYHKLKDKYSIIISKKDWLKSIYYNATAEYVFYETKCCFQRRVKGQKVIYLGHGCPSLKNCKGFITLNEKLDTCAVITSENVRKVMSEMLGFPQNKFKVNGLARNDKIFNSTVRFIDVDPTMSSSKVILWMPTFRESNIIVNNERRNDSDKQYLYGLPLIYEENDLFLLNEALKVNNLVMIIKPHPRALKCGIDNIKYSNIKVWTNDYLANNQIDIYSLFWESAGMISDYSSVTFDYILSDHPVAYIIDDFDSYKLGFAYDDILSYMPGEHVKTQKDLIKFFQDIAADNDLYKEARHQVDRWANAFHDGNNAKRIIEIFEL